MVQLLDKIIMQLRKGVYCFGTCIMSSEMSWCVVPGHARLKSFYSSLVRTQPGTKTMTFLKLHDIFLKVAHYFDSCTMNCAIF